MSKRICILVLIGLPATGKTTFSKWLLTLPQAPFNVIHLCYDDHLEVMAEEKSARFEFKNQRSNILSIIQLLIDELKNTSNDAKLPSHLESLVKSSLNHCNNDFLVICDDNNYYRSMRHKLYQICRQKRCAYAQIHFDCIMQLAIERNNARSTEESVPQEIIQRMAERLEKPDPIKQHWESNTFLLNAENDDYTILRTQVLVFLSKTFENNIQPMTNQMRDHNNGSVQSVVHQLDLLLRKRIGDILQANNMHDAKELQKLANLLCAKRKGILNDVKIKNEKNNSSVSAAEFNEFVELLY
ncbi:L-seryl-tRNA(Sec) kinase [Eurosta solidaginis]|uniref:L-seryl-tRNA(Sec) kinase n=1 Tax=Eurosta solidaginis TaxID=178769 RepID=UPI0035308B23